MKVVLRLLASMIIFAMSLPACHGEDGGSATKNHNHSDNGENLVMKTYYMGRFALDVPVEMKQAVQAHTFRYARIEEFMWPQSVNKDNARQNNWNERLAAINKLKAPRGIKKVLIKSINSDSTTNWYKGALYYGSYVSSKEAKWGVMIDDGAVGIWGEISGLVKYEDYMRRDLLEILSAYRIRGVENQAGHEGNWYHLKYGSINLPYMEQEKTYARFEGDPLDLKLEVEMKEAHKVEKLRLAERLAASIATSYAPGVDVDKIRSGGREAAGLKGEELVMRMSASGEDTQIQFIWEYHGEAESGERPKIQITMETPDGRLDEKLKVWDAILDSFKPMYR